jgi:hypothetical protein
MGSNRNERPPEHKRAPGLEAQGQPARSLARLLGLGRELTDEEVGREIF